MQKPTPEELQALHHWMREPDWADEFSLADIVDWMNRRPISVTYRLAAEAHGPDFPLTTCGQMNGFKTEAEGYAASLRQMADWVQEAQEGTVAMHQRIDIGDVDVDELRAAANFIDRLSALTTGK